LEEKHIFFLKILYLQLEQLNKEKNREEKKYTNKGCVFTPFDI